MTDKMKKLIDEIDRSEAEIIKAALEAQGIQTELYQEGAGLVYGLTVGLLGEVEIWVDADHFETAQIWLHAYDNDTIEGLPEEES